MRGPGSRGGGLRRGLGTALALLLAAESAGAAQVRPDAVAIQPLMDPSPGGAGAPAIDDLHDGAPLVARLVLSLVPRMDVRWRPVDPGGPDVLALLPVPAGTDPPKGVKIDPSIPRSPSAAIEGGRRMLETLPRRWRRRAMKAYKALGLGAMSAESADLLVRALAARSSGDPLRSAALIERAGEEPRSPLHEYLRGVAYLEADRIHDAAAVMARAEARFEDLPRGLVGMTRAVTAAARGDRRDALSRARGTAEGHPSLSEAWLLQSRLSRAWCDLYDQSAILQSLEMALRAEPCCPTCALDLGQMLAFTERPATAPGRIRSDAGCEGDPLGSARDRALAVALASSGAMEEGLAAAGRAEARDVSALSAGLAATYLLAGDHARLDQAYDADADLTLPPMEALERHLHSGLGALWQGRPSAAAGQFERVEEIGSEIAGDAPDHSSWVQWARTLKIRSYLAAGRVEEARAAAAEAREAGRGNLNGLLIYTTAMTDIAAGDTDSALVWTRRLTPANQKFWRYLLYADIDLAKGNVHAARAHLSDAAQGINDQTTVCPGVSVEPYMLHAQAKVLLALGRFDAAEHLLLRLVDLGSRGLLAPDVVVPSWELVAEARRAQGSAGAAADAYRELLDRWGSGEATPVLDRARRGLESLESARQSGVSARPRPGVEPGGSDAALIYNDRASEPAVKNP